MKRMLSIEEKKLTLTNRNNLSEKKVIMEGEIKRLEFNLDFLLEHNYRKLKRDLCHELRNVKHELSEIDNNLKIIDDILTNGVEIKEKTEEK